MTQNNNQIETNAQSLQVAVISRFLLPNNYLTKHGIKSHTGRIYWLSKHKKEFCKLYLDANYKDFDKYQLHFFMMKSISLEKYQPKAKSVMKKCFLIVKIQNDKIIDC